MARFEENIMGLIPKEDWLEIGFNVTRPNDPIDGLFDDERTDNIIAKWNSISSEYQIPMMAYFHGWDTEALTTFRVPVDVHNIEKGLIKVKINQSERMMQLLHNGVQHEQMYEYVINDGVRLADQVFTRSKVAKNELMSTGKITIKENNLNLEVDYGVPADQTSFSIDVAGDIAAKLVEIEDLAQSKGVTITGMLTSKKVLSKMRQNQYLQKSIKGTAAAGTLLKMSELQAFMTEEFDITSIITNDLTYGAEGKIGTDGRPQITTKRYFPQDKITFFATNPGGKLGRGLWGDPPSARNFETRKISGSRPFVTVDQYMETDPDILWTRASALFIPVLYNPNSLFISAVTDSSI